MPRFTPYTAGQLRRARERLTEACYTPVAELTVRAWRTPEPVPYAERETGQVLDLQPGDTWGDLFDCAWFRFTGTVPEAVRDDDVVLLLDVHGEMCVVDADGAPQRGLTTVSSTFDLSLGQPGKRVLPWYCESDRGDVEVWADAGCNDLFGNLQGNGTLREARIAVCHEELRALAFDVEVLHDFLDVLDEDTPRHQQVRRALTEVARLLDSPAALEHGLAAVAVEGRALLAPHLARRGGDPALRISAVGHAHMDLAWLWPIRETIRKGARTFATALELFERYPDYVFGASQPQYFQWMKDHYPALWARIRDAVRDGRIETQGCMWVEADTNVSGGEALVRQILLGRRFWQAEFGMDSTYLWLPDVFGYSGALPQILRQAGVDVFATQKLSWSLINRFPHHSFLWQGIDGSRVAAHMFAEDTYNGPALPRSVRKMERNYRDKDVSAHALMVFGIGDGGGGPGAEHLERLSRIRNLEGLSPVCPESAGAFFDKWKEEVPGFARWVGELYLERHQGTLTTQAANKRWNRKLELALRDLELLAVMAARTAGVAYPADRLDAIWKEVLLYQFHDILPGSSIKRVYDESVPRYAAMHAEVESLIAERLRALGRGRATPEQARPVLVVNTLSWAREEWMDLDGRWLKVAVPGLGSVVVDAAQAADAPQLGAHVVATRIPDTAGPEAAGDGAADEEANTAGARLENAGAGLENDCLRVEFGPQGRLTSVIDKATGRQFVPEGAWGNELLVFADSGDAWDFPMDYAEAEPRHPQRVSLTTRVNGPRAILEQVFEVGHSRLTQSVVLTAGSRRIDFHTRATWRERASMLRVRFPVAVRAAQATFDIQFGQIQRPTHRNTTWDLARDEVAAHKWADLSQPDAGAALLNDGKYGHRVKDNVLDLNLIRSVPHPGPRHVADDDVPAGEPHGHYTDQCEHEVTYSFLPHAGDVAAGGVARAGYELNVPLRAAPLDVETAAPKTGLEAAGGSWLDLACGTLSEPPAAGDVTSGQSPHPNGSVATAASPAVVVEAVKAAEDGSGDTIVRLYERNGAAAWIALRPPADVAAAHVADLMENRLQAVATEEGRIRLELHPYQILSLRLRHGTRDDPGTEE